MSYANPEERAADIAAHYEIYSGTLDELRTAFAPDVEGLAVAINTAQIDPAELRLGRDLVPVAERIARAYRDG